MQKDTQQTNKWGSLNYFNKFNIKNYSFEANSFSSLPVTL